MTRETYLKTLFGEGADTSGLDDWEVVPGFIDGEHAATALIKGSEIHFGLVPAFRNRVTRGRTREFLKPLLERNGFLTTRVLLASPDKQQFVERVGFKRTWEDDTFQFYLLGALPWR